MKTLRFPFSHFFFLLVASIVGCQSANRDPTSPSPAEIPVPEIATTLPKLPGVDDLPVRKKIPDIMVMNDGTRVTTVEQWAKRREEMKTILEYYAVGRMPPPPGNVKGMELSSASLLDGKVKYQLVHLSFGPEEKLGFDIGILTPGDRRGPFPTIIMASFVAPPGAKPLKQLARPPGQGHGVDALLPVEPITRPSTESDSDATTRPSRQGGRRGGRGGGMFRQLTPLQAATRNSEILDRGYALVQFDYNDCGEDTTLRMPDGSWAYRTTRFFPSYPNYDWGLTGAWAWGLSRIVDYCQTQDFVDKSAIVAIGHSRLGKMVMVAGAFDDRIAVVCPAGSGAGGTGAYRFNGPGRGGKEGLADMMKKYPNQFSPHLHEFWGHVDQLPFDEHWFIALVAPRAFISLEGTRDQNCLAYAMEQSYLGARPAFELLGVPDREGVNFADHPHELSDDDVKAALDFADKNVRGMKVDRPFDQFPATQPAP